MERIHKGRRKEMLDVDKIGVGELDKVIEKAENYRMEHPLLQ